MYVFIVISVCEVHKVIRKRIQRTCIILLILRNFINFTIQPRFQSNNAKLQEHSSLKKNEQKVSRDYSRYILSKWTGDIQFFPNLSVVIVKSTRNIVNITDFYEMPCTAKRFNRLSKILMTNFHKNGEEAALLYIT